MKEYAERFYKSQAWINCRNAFIKSLPSKLCNRCHNSPGKIVHHKKHITEENIDNPMVTLNFNNLEYLCQECHNQEHMSSKATRSGLDFDEEGNLVEREETYKTNNIYLPIIEKPENKEIYIICGAPGSGKSTYVKEKAKQNDLIIDLDNILMQFTNEPIYTSAERYIKLAICKRNEILNSLNYYTNTTIWFIVSAPTREERKHWKEQLGGTIIILDTPKEECYKRLENDVRRTNNILKYKVATNQWFIKYTDGYIDKKISPP